MSTSEFTTADWDSGIEERVHQGVFLERFPNLTVFFGNAFQNVKVLPWDLGTEGRVHKCHSVFCGNECAQLTILEPQTTPVPPETNECFQIRVKKMGNRWRLSRLPSGLSFKFSGLWLLQQNPGSSSEIHVFTGCVRTIVTTLRRLLLVSLLSWTVMDHLELRTREVI